MKLPPRFHVVTDATIATASDLASRAAEIAASGRIALHARAPGLPGRRLFEITSILGDAARGTQAEVFVNDRVDVAVAYGADGIHLPAAGLPVPEARRVAGTIPFVGRSAHTTDEARRAHADGADYVFLGPIWPTSSHPDRPPLGLAVVAAAAPARVVAIGGITTARIAECLRAGAYGVAVRDAVWSDDNPGSIARAMSLLLNDE